MANRISAIAITSVLLSLFLGCSSGITSDTPLSTESSNPPSTDGVYQPMPDDFYIIYEIMNLPYNNDWYYSPEYFWTALDTNEHIVGWHSLQYDGTVLIYDGWACADYYIPHNNLQGLYDAIIKYGVKSYSSPIVLVDEFFDMSWPQDYFRITFRLNNEIYQTTFGNLLFSWPDNKHEDFKIFWGILHDEWMHGRIPTFGTSESTRW
ncbi:MAG: hypothetical protein FWH57_12815 [Oscillospiraceae bacterium]|nr:hypothetical protein [Oscillospiraceae bacterium]